MELYSALALVSSANELMDSAYHFDEGRLERLGNMRSQMLQAGFDAPFAGLLARTATEAEELAPSEVEDLKKQVGNFRYIASLKKFTLNRARISIAAHRLAKYFRDDLKLPLDGNFVQRLADAGDFAILAYREIMDSLEGFGTQSTQAIATVSYMQEGEKKTAPMRLTGKGNAEDAARDAFGGDAKIVSVKIQKTKTGIIKGKGARIALLTYFVTSAAAEVRAELAAAERGVPAVAKYNSILAQNKLVRDSRLDLAEGFDNVKKTLFREELMSQDKEKKWKLEPSLEKEISRRRKYAHEEMLKRSLRNMWKSMFVYYMSTNSAIREGGKAIPGLAAKPAKEQLALFVKVDIGIGKSTELLLKKMDAEGKSSGMDQKLFGAGFAVSVGKAKPEEVAKLFGMNEEEVKSAAIRVSSLAGGRGGAFLSKLGKKKG